MISLIVPHIISLSLSHLIGEDIDAEEINDLLDITHWQLEESGVGSSQPTSTGLWLTKSDIIQKGMATIKNGEIWTLTFNL